MKQQRLNVAGQAYQRMETYYNNRKKKSEQSSGEGLLQRKPKKDEQPSPLDTVADMFDIFRSKRMQLKNVNDED